MRLCDWLKAGNMSGVEFADKIGVHRSTVSRWLAGTAKPRWDELPKIERATDGKVMANDFVSIGAPVSAPPAQPER
ncbi:MAG: helix-turn-helix transcriptional regulator [Hyphomicrobiaceae bacterium]|nr:MAG: helix-turn-helix transcriptional regulator [Hyphomicrobiaceae bacterium]